MDANHPYWIRVIEMMERIVHSGEMPVNSMFIENFMFSNAIQIIAIPFISMSLAADNQSWLIDQRSLPTALGPNDWKIVVSVYFR